MAVQVENGSLMDCVRRARHHCDWTKFFELRNQYDKGRIRWLESALKQISGQLCDVKLALDRGDISAAQAVFERPIQFGVDA